MFFKELPYFGSNIFVRLTDKYGCKIIIPVEISQTKKEAEIKANIARKKLQLFIDYQEELPSEYA